MTESEATTVEAAENAIAAKEPPKAITPELFVSISPHFKSADSVSKIMWTVVACLMPPLVCPSSFSAFRR